MFARTGKYLVIVALVFATGLHWAALQTVAWTTMFAANVTTTSFAQAVSDTFDGQHPCCLCKMVSAGKAAEKKSDATTLLKKIEFPPVTEKFALFAPGQFTLLPAIYLFAESVSTEPLLPPPRSLLA